MLDFSSSSKPGQNNFYQVHKFIDLLYLYHQFSFGETPRSIVADMLGYANAVSESELQSRYYIHFLKGMNPFNSSGLNVTSLALYNQQKLICHKINELIKTSFN